MNKLPWDFIEGRDEPTPGFSPVQPSDVGIEFGGHLARFCDVEYAKTGRDARCLDCAFRLGTLPNTNAGSLANAFKCVFEGEEIFYCHVHKGKPCEGYMMLRRQPSVPPSTPPRQREPTMTPDHPQPQRKR